MNQDCVIDAEYVNQWLGEDDAILNLGIENVLKVKKIITFYTNIFAPNREIAVRYPGDSTDRNTRGSVVEVPYDMIMEGKIDQAVGLCMYRLRKDSMPTPGLGNISSSWDVLRSFCGQCYIDGYAGKSLMDLLDEYMKYKGFTNRNNFLKAIDGSTRFSFLVDSIYDIKIIVDTFNEIKINTTSSFAVKKYVAKYMDACWEEYELNGNYSEFVTEIMNFKSFFYGKSDDYTFAKGVTLDKIQKASPRKLIELAIKTFHEILEKRIISRIGGFLKLYESAKNTHSNFPNSIPSSLCYEGPRTDWASIAAKLRAKENYDWRKANNKTDKVKTTAGCDSITVWDVNESLVIEQDLLDAEVDFDIAEERELFEAFSFDKKEEEIDSVTLEEIHSISLNKPYEVHFADITLQGNSYDEGLVDIRYPITIFDIYKA